MDNNKNYKKPAWATKLGFVTGPLILCCAAAVWQSGGSKAMVGIFVAIGLFRLGSAMFLYYKSKQE